MTAEAARISWGVLAALGGVASFVGLVFSWRGYKRARGRYARDGVARTIYRRDLGMMIALVAVGAGGIVKALLLLALVRWYGHDLDPILANLGVPVFGAYLIDTLNTMVVTTLAPIWLSALYRAQDRPRHGGIPEKGV